MNILLSSYSFGANRGSEAGVGWNVARGLALRGHNVTVITTREFGDINKKAIDIEKLSIKLIEADCGITHYPSARSYRQWQRNIRQAIKQETASQPYDIIHHITFNQYRDIHDIFATDIPYLIGPIGGAELIPGPLFSYGDMPLQMKLKECIRYCPLDALPLTLRCRAHKATGIVLASNISTAERLHNLPRPAIVCPAIAIHNHEIVEHPAKTQEKGTYILFDGGLARPQKGTWLALRAIFRLWQAGTCIPIRMVGIKATDRKIILNYARKINLPAAALHMEEQVTRNTMLQYMQKAAVMLSCVYRDSGSMALLEALAQGCRIVCLDIPSQDWLPHEYARKLEIHSTSNCMEQAIAAALRDEICAPPHTNAWHSSRVAWLRQHMTWDSRLDALETHYNAIVS